jgi:hypothetical protein
MLFLALALTGGFGGEGSGDSGMNPLLLLAATGNL